MFKIISVIGTDLSSSFSFSEKERERERERETAKCLVEPLWTPYSFYFIIHISYTYPLKIITYAK